MTMYDDDKHKLNKACVLVMVSSGMVLYVLFRGMMVCYVLQEIQLRSMEELEGIKDGVQKLHDKQEEVIKHL